MPDTVAVVARNAKLYKAGVAFGYGKDITVETSIETEKDYSADSKKPAVLEAGNITFKWSCRKMYVTNALLTLGIAGTKFNMQLSKVTTPVTGSYINLTNCLITSHKVTANMIGGGAILEDVSGECMDLEPVDS